MGITLTDIPLPGASTACVALIANTTWCGPLDCIDRAGKIVYRAEGYDEEGFQKSLVSAIHQALAPASAALQ